MPFTILKETFEPLMPSIVLSVVGGIASFCLEKTHTLRQLISGLIVSGFAGAIASLLLVDAPFSPHTKIAIGGMAGYMGSFFLNAVAKRIAKTVEKSVEKTAIPWSGKDRRGNCTGMPWSGKERRGNCTGKPERKD